MSSRLFIPIAVVAWLCVCDQIMSKEAPAPVASRTLRVAVSEAPPFAHKTPQGEWEGLAVDLWKESAAALGWKYVWQEFPRDESLRKVAAGEVDVVVSKVVLAPERELLMDFSAPFLTSKLAIVVMPDSKLSWRTVAELFLESNILWGLGGILFLAFVVGILIWRIERKRNPHHFEDSPWRGIGSGLWYATVTLTTVGYGDKVPVSTIGRVLAMVWMLTSLILISTFTATVTASMTIGHLKGRIQSPDDLSRLVTTAVRSSPGETYLRERGSRVLSAKSSAEALELLRNGKASAFVHDFVTFKAIQHEGGQKIQILPYDLADTDFYAFALPPRSPLVEPLSRQVLLILYSPKWGRIKKGYLTD